MPISPLTAVLEYLRRVSAAKELEQLADADLLERFRKQHDEAAFAVLVHRHGPMVWGVCLRMLGDFHNAEDAFQATFIVLVRKARSIRKSSPLANWLYGVAQRVALKARAKAAARNSRLREFTDMPGNERLDEKTWQDLRPILDEEIARLPKRCQAPIVLCYFEGKSYDEAAQELGCPKSSLQSRLLKAREMLGKRLAKRGLALSAGAVMTALSEKAGAAPVGAMLTINTVKAGVALAAGKGVAGNVLSAQAVALAKETITGMALAKGKLVGAVMLVGLIMGGAGLAGYHGIDTGATKPTQQPLNPVLASGDGKPAQAQRAVLTEEIDPLLVEAWRKAGAEPRGYYPSGTPPFDFPLGLSLGQTETTTKAQPNFGFYLAREWPANGIKALPQPTGPFALELNLSNVRITPAQFKELAALPHLQHLILRFTNTDLQMIHGEDLEGIRELKQLPKLTLQLRVSSAGFKEIAELDQLEWLRATKLADANLHQLSALPKLETLLLHDSPDLTEEGFKALVRFKKLRTFEHTGALEMTSAMIQELAALNQLQSLSISRTLTESMVQDLAGLTQLRALRLGSTRLTEPGLKALANLKQLHRLDIIYSPVTGESFDVFAGLSKLQELSIDLRPVKNEAPTHALINELAKLVELRKLSLTGHENTEFRTQPGFDKLESLYLQSMPITDEGFLAIAQLKNLDTLSITGSTSGTRGLNLAGLKKLRKLILESTMTGNAEMRTLASLTELRWLSLGRTNVSDAGLKELAKLHRLEVLDLSRATYAPQKGKDGRLTDVGLKELAGLRNLRALMLVGTGVTDAGLAHLAGMKELRYLTLQNTWVTAQGVDVLRKVLPKLEQVDWSTRKGKK